MLEEKIKKRISNLLNDNIVQKKLENKRILVLSGGGLKGMSHIGVLQAMHDYDCLKNIDTFAGSSIGSIMATLIILGFSPKDIADLILFLDISKLGKFKIDNILNEYGLDNGDKFVLAIKKIFNSMGFAENTTFKNLYDRTKKKLIVTASCINTKSVVYYSVDTNPDMECIMALRMSISIPFYFTPVKYKNYYYVDGSCIDNYPIHLFQNNLEQVIGIYLVDQPIHTEKIDNFESLLLNTVETLFEGVNYNSYRGYENYSIKINVSDLTFMDLGLNMEKKKELIDIGYHSFVNKFID